MQQDMTFVRHSVSFPAILLFLQESGTCQILVAVRHVWRESSEGRSCFGVSFEKNPIFSLAMLIPPHWRLTDSSPIE